MEPIVFDYIKNGDLESVKKLVKSGLNIETKNFGGFSLLNYSVYYDKIDIFKYLLSKGVDVNSKNYRNVTPLHNSVLVSDLEIIKLLLEHGADPYMKDIDGNIAMDYVKDKEEFLNLIKLTKLKELYK